MTDHNQRKEIAMSDHPPATRPDPDVVHEVQELLRLLATEAASRTSGDETGEHQDAARRSVWDTYRDLLEETESSADALRMTKLAALSIIRAADAVGAGYLLARTRGVLVALDEIEAS